MNAALAIAKVRDMFPELTDVVVPDSFFAAWYNWAIGKTGTAWGGVRLEGVALLLAHAWYRYKMSGGSGINGAITSISTASLSASFAQNAQQPIGSDQDLTSTFAGSSWIALRNSIPAIVLPRIYL